ncbi:MAG: cytochrome c-type biogenesis protein [Chloroflexota bacterium]
MSIARIRPGVPVLLVLVLIVVLSLLVAGCASSSETLSPAELEEVAQGIDRSLMCPVCPNETIDQSQVEIAVQMRAMVREKLAQGESRDEILKFFADPDRYGPGILAEPPKSGFSLLVWVLPPIVLLLGSSILVMTVRAMRRGHQGYTDEEAPQATAELEPYLSAVDQEIQRLTLRGGGDTREPPDTVPEGPNIGTSEGRAE